MSRYITHHISLRAYRRITIHKLAYQMFKVVRYNSLLAERSSMPTCLTVTAWTSEGEVMGVRHNHKPFHSVQFHPESICTDYGKQLLRNFGDVTLEHEKKTQKAPNRTNKNDNFENECQAYPSIRRIDGMTSHSTQRVHVSSLPYRASEQIFHHQYRESDDVFWLDSSLIESNRSRFSFMGNGSGVLQYYANTRTLHTRMTGEIGTTRVLSETEDFFGVIDQYQTKNRLNNAHDFAILANLPFDFHGGLVGYLGYEMKKESLPDSESQDMPGEKRANRRMMNENIERAIPGSSEKVPPDANFFICHRFIAFDHQEQQVYLVCLSATSIEDPDGSIAAQTWFDEMKTQWPDDNPQNLPPVAPAQDKLLEFEYRQNKEQYIQSVESCKQQIRDGQRTYLISLIKSSV